MASPRCLGKEPNTYSRGMKLTNDSKQSVRNLIIKENNIIPKSKWGKYKPNLSNLDLDWGYNKIAIHHSGERGISTPEAIEKLHRTSTSYSGYGDIGYHYLIDKKGKIYEGRSILYKGAHIGGHNIGNIGILLQGDFNHQWWDFDDDLTKEQLQALDKLIYGLKKHFSIYYLGGHKEYSQKTSDSCPGNTVMAIIDKLRNKHGLQKP